MPRSLPVTVTLALLLGAACLPMRHGFLRPSAPGAEHHRTAVGKCEWVPNRAVLKAPRGVLLAIDADRAESSGPLHVELVVYVPGEPGLSVELVTRTFHVTDSAGASYSADGHGEELESMTWRADPRPSSDREVWFGHRLTGLPYSLEATIPGVPGGVLHVQVPALRIGGEPFEPPEIEMKRASEWFIAPFNC